MSNHIHLLIRPGKASVSRGSGSLTLTGDLTFTGGTSDPGGPIYT